MKYLSRR